MRHCVTYCRFLGIDDPETGRPILDIWAIRYSYLTSWFAVVSSIATGALSLYLL